MRPRSETPIIDLEMYAWEVDRTAARLRDLRLAELEDLALAGAALVAALLATALWPSLAIPLFLGGLAVGALGVRALWRRWDLVDRLAGEHEAYAIPEILAYASRSATRESRRSLAATIEGFAPEPGQPNAARLARVAEELDALVTDLENDELDFDPASAVACSRLVSGVSGVLYDETVPADEVLATIRHIRCGFRPRRADGTASA